MSNHFTSPSGSASWASSTNILTPCSIATAFSNAAAGDTVFLRGGDYVLPTGNDQYHLATGNSGNSGARIIIQKYESEIHKIIANGLEDTFYIQRQYWTFDGLTVESDNVPDTSAGIFSLGDNISANYTHIINCNLWLKRSTGRDNISVIRLQSDRANYVRILNNVIRGQGRESDSRLNSGVNYLGGGNVGTKVLNNEIYDCMNGVFVKHANADSFIGEAEIAYNYIHDCYWPESILGTGGGIYGNPVYIDIHDNLTNIINLGDNGGGPQGNNCLINHNTAIEPAGLRLRSPSSEGPIHDCDITNNVFPTKTTDDYGGSTEDVNTWDYNMYGDDPAIGPNDLGNTSPTYVGGSNPSTILGYALTSSSPGYLAGSDGKDFGADVSLVGPGESAPVGLTGAVTNNPSPVEYSVTEAEVTGTATPGEGRSIASVALVSGTGSVTGTTSWVATCTSLQVGINNFTVRITDDEDETFNVNFSITRNAISLAPTVIETSNPSPIPFAQTSADVLGTVAVDPSRTLSYMVVQWGDGTIVYDDDTWTLTCNNLAVGDTVYTVRAVDSESDLTDIDVWVTRLAEGVSLPPTGQVTSNPSPVSYETTEAQVTGTATPASGRTITSVTMILGSGSVVVS